MSADDPTFKRLGTILFLFVFILVFNILSTIYLNSSEGYEYLSDTGIYSKEELPDESIIPTDWIGLVFGFIGFFFGFFLINVPDLPIYMTVFITPVYILTLITFWYIVIDFIKDINILGTSL